MDVATIVSCHAVAMGSSKRMKRAMTAIKMIMTAAAIVV